MDIVKGQRKKLLEVFSEINKLEVVYDLSKNKEVDICCFGLDEKGQLSDDRYMIFYNQEKSPDNSICLDCENNKFVLELNMLSEKISSLVFTLSSDTGFKDIDFININILSGSGEKLCIPIECQQFMNKTAVISFEIYKKDGYRIKSVLDGYDGGLSRLLKDFGGEELAETKEDDLVENQSTISIGKVSLEKKLEKAPELVKLAKPIKVVLEKNNICNAIARVGVVIDSSGSMTGRYKNGTVQNIINRVLPLAVQFDDDGELDCWYYGTTPRRMSGITIDTYKNSVPSDFSKFKNELGGKNNEVAVMELVVSEYENSKIPAYVIFITDGGVNQKGEIKKIIRNSSKYPIFWQFIGVGGKNYGVLESLDDLSGCVVDNANFFALDDFREISDDRLYEKLINEFSIWFKIAKEKGIY